MVPTAQLRVFTPLTAFPPRERERWAAYVDAGRGLTRAEVAGAEADGAAARLVGGRSPLGPDAALVRRAGKRVLICPLQLDLRAAHALAAFRRTIPEVVADQFAPPGADRLERLLSTGQAPHILDEPWAVPLHWFVAFGPDERRLHDPLAPRARGDPSAPRARGDPPEGRGPRLRYLTTVGQAVLRLEHAIEVVESTVDDGDEVLLAFAELAAWLDGFPAPDGSVVELDYGRVAALVPPDVLREDRTCAELTDALQALAAGDLLAAAATYGQVRARWSTQRARHHAS